MAAYEEAKGDMDHIYETVMLSDVAVDDERFRSIIDEAIKVSSPPILHSQVISNINTGWRL